MLNKLHPEASFLMIARGLMARDAELEKDIGRNVQYKPAVEAWHPDMGTQVRDETFRIIGVQKIYDGSIAYRVLCNNGWDTFGRPFSPDEVIFLD